jgi:hypothetical protein
MAKKREPFTFESNLDKIVPKIEEAPAKVLNIVGKNLVKEIKSTTMKSQFHQRKSILTKTLGFWARKREKDLQIGFKMSIPGIVGNMITGKETDPIKPVVVKNAQIISDMIKVTIDEIGKK